jgi:hypothetical protein
MSLSFRGLKPGGVYVTASPNLLWSDDDSDALIADIPAGARFLVIEALGDAVGGDLPKAGFYRILIDGIVGELIVRNGEVALMESQ